MNDKTKILIISPSEIITNGLKVILARTEFVVDSLADVPATVDAGMILVDPVLTSYNSVFSFGLPVVAVIHAAYDERSLSQFSEVISIYDQPQVMVRKLRKVVSGSADSDPLADGKELSPREKEILVCVAKGMLNKEIAYKYNLSIFTVMTHRKNITAKTGIKSIAGLTAYAILQGLIDIESIK
ncbi:MAG: helix-turn-helix transcriptional regulator [Bacteroidales bacterium]|nr:helix-turn-helix transcriptional regulator [Bacteroidales bacterium]MBQ4288229.1 helix-turn-helix transcriptional regulator [Bacteroidales bacterium]MBQ9888959.1 helix-turn-helix transcriptional regulator [Bacteroidales bacterium]